jgi:hypothetical protein
MHLPGAHLRPGGHPRGERRCLLALDSDVGRDHDDAMHELGADEDPAPPGQPPAAVHAAHAREAELTSSR